MEALQLRTDHFDVAFAQSVKVIRANEPDGGSLPKAIIYDTTKGFSRFVKSKYSQHFQITVCHNLPQFERDQGCYDLAFICFDNYAAAMVFTRLSKSVKLMFVYVRPDFKSKAMTVHAPQTVLLSSDWLKKEMKSTIDAHLHKIDSE